MAARFWPRSRAVICDRARPTGPYDLPGLKNSIEDDHLRRRVSFEHQRGPFYRAHYTVMPQSRVTNCQEMASELEAAGAEVQRCGSKGNELWVDVNLSDFAND